MARRKENLEYLLSLIEKNPGRTIQFWQYKLSELCGISPKTVTDYLKTLRILRRICFDGTNCVTILQTPA